MSSGNEPAFPVVTPPTCVVYGKGLTKREYFGGLAMMGQLATGAWDGDVTAEEIALDSVLMADALIAALERKEK